MRVIRRRTVVVMSAVVLVSSALFVVVPAGAQPEGAQGESDLEVYVGEVDAAGIEVLRDLGVDAESLPDEASEDPPMSR